MKRDLSAEALVELLYRYYPARLHSTDPRYEASEQAQRLEALLRNAREDSAEWAHFVQQLRADLPGCTVLEMTNLWHDPCHTCRVWLPGVQPGGSHFEAIVCLVSLLAPVYALYACRIQGDSPQESWLRLSAFPSEFQPYEAHLATRLESDLGLTRLSEELLRLPIPDLVPRSTHLPLGEARLIDCLFTSHRWCG